MREFQSVLKFYNVPWTKTNNHVTSDSRELVALKQELNYSYIKKDRSLHVGLGIEDIKLYNYCSFKNPAHENIEYFCFIDSCEYVAEKTTKINFTIDSWYTYKDKVTFMPSLVEREHVTDDVIGKHVLHEGLEYGEYQNFSEDIAIIDKQGRQLRQEPVTNQSNQVVIFAVNAVPKSFYTNPDTEFKFDGNMFSAFVPVVGATYGNMYSGCKLYWFDLTDYENIAAFLLPYIEHGGEDYVICGYIADKDLTPRKPTLNIGNEPSETYFDAHEVKEGAVFDLNGTTIYHMFYVMPVTTNNEPFKNKDGTIYKPKNNKLYTFPYVTLRVHNNNGNVMYVNIEEANETIFNDWKQVNFKVVGNMTNLSPVAKLFIDSAKNGQEDTDESMTLSGYPQISWNSNAFKSWLANNGGNIAMQATGIVTGAALGLATGGAAVPVIAGGLTGAMGMMANVSDQSKHHSKMQGSMSSGSVNILAGLQAFMAQYKCISGEMAKKIDDFFTMYGYKVNALKVPNIKTRPVFNFVKCNECNIKADIPEQDKQNIRELFERGVTIWHDILSMYDYTKVNK